MRFGTHVILIEDKTVFPPCVYLHLSLKNKFQFFLESKNLECRRTNMNKTNERSSSFHCLVRHS